MSEPCESEPHVSEQVFYRLIRTIAGASALLAALACPVEADDLAAFYGGKRIQMVIGWEVGGGYDIYARLLARHLGRHIPGQPSIVPQNMPGAGSRVAANWLYNIAPKDGTAIATIGQGTPLDQAMGEPSVRYDAAKLSWIGNPIMDNLVTAVTQRSGVESLDDLKTKGGLFCGDVGAGPTSTFPEILNQLIGTRNKIIPGFPGVNSVHLAMERGEVDCIGGTTWSSLKATRGAKLRSREVGILIQWGTLKDPEISDYMRRDIPLILDIASNALDRQALNYIVASATIGRPFAAPPGMPQERVQALRRAFDATMTDPEFLAEARKASMDIKPLAGEALQSLASEVAQAPAQGLTRAKQLIGRTGQ
jgi:tripartite-type tricarboxylate transporter receptor subunit TctC